MKTRHRIPTIFSIYMVDVLCCALGCVIFLWLVYFREARERAHKAAQTNEELTKTLAALNLSTSELSDFRSALAASSLREKDLQARLARLQDQQDLSLKDLALLKKEKDDTALALALSEKLLAALRLDFKNLKADNSKTRNALALSDKALEELLAAFKKLQTDAGKTAIALALSDKTLAALRLDFKNLQLLADKTTTSLAAKTISLEELQKKLLAAETLTRTLEKDLVARNSRLQEADLDAKRMALTLADLNALAKAYREKLSVADVRVKLLEDDLAKGKKVSLDIDKRYKDLLLSQDILTRRLLASAKDLDVARNTAESLKGDKLNLTRQIRQIREAADHRFAGITLTGQNVLFLVDMSGSMELTDENTPDPDKWPEVCETLAKIMRSLPDLKQYQVILFSDKVRYPFGKEGRWLPYDPDASSKTVLAGVKAIKPVGETNMAAVFEEAFRFRPDGLDTIYVLSDGLPNAGPGVPPGALGLSATQRIDHLSKYVRSRLKFVLNRPGPGQPRVRINTIGFFFESPEVGAFLWALAREHDGNFVGMNK